MSTAQKRQVLRELMRQLQTDPALEKDCAVLLGRLYPGGLLSLEKDWHGWIRQVGAKVLSPPGQQPNQPKPSRRPSGG
jgi:hypothetical protein